MEKLDPQHSEWLQRSQTQTVLEILNRDGAVTRCVGGCVRDTLMGQADIDTEVDMATDLPPEKVMARLKEANIKTVPTGIKHGTVSAILYATGPDKKQLPLVYEITTLRVDVKTDGRHAEIAFTQDWHGDAARRDFTINALYADADGTLHDPTGDGLADIAARRVRFIGDAAARIEEDYLRVLRYFRFHFRMTPDTAPDETALAACRAAAAGLRGLSGERKQMEMLKIMALPHAHSAAQTLQRAGLLRPVLGVEPVEFDMLAAMIALDDDPLLRLMTLMPSIDAGHVLAATLRLSKKQTMRVMMALERPLDVTKLRHALYFHGPQAVADRACLALAAGQGDRSALQAARTAAAAFEKPRFPLTGAMMQAAGLTAGPDMGVMSKKLEDWWVKQGFPDAEAVEAELKKRLG